MLRYVYASRLTIKLCGIRISHTGDKVHDRHHLEVGIIRRLKLSKLQRYQGQCHAICTLGFFAQDSRNKQF